VCITTNLLKQIGMLAVNQDAYDQHEAKVGGRIVEVMHRHFGFVLPQEKVVYASTMDRVINVEEFNKVFLCVIMEGSWEPLANDVRVHIAQFITSMASASPTDLPPSCLYDLRLTCPSFLGSINSKVLVERRQCRVERKFSGSHPSVLKDVFEVSVPGTPCFYSIYVYDAGIAAECVRANMSSTAEIATFLVKHGYRFFTALAVEDIVAPENNKTGGPKVHHEGVRQQGYKPDHADYLEYQSRLIQFLESPQGQIVYKMGGLYWHIAMSCLSWRKSDVLLGPVFAENSPLICFTVRENGNDVGTKMDDYLSDEELDLVCGTYKIETGMGSAFLISFIYSSYRL